MDAEGGPVFVSGADRSGIGLVGDLLDAHPAFALSRRTNFWSFYHGRFGDLSIPANLDRCVSAMMRFRRISELGTDPDRLRSEFTSGGFTTYAELFALIGSHHAEQRTKPRWGDKSLNSERHASLILDSFPDGRMIHVLRDPRDRFVSVETHRGGRRGGIPISAAVWRESARLATNNRAQFGQRYLVLRYEDLVADPGGQLGSLCAWLGEDFDAEMFVGVGASPSADPTEVVHSRSVGRFSSDLSTNGIALLDRLVAPEMSEHGYDRSEVGLSNTERLIVGIESIFAKPIMDLWRPWTAMKTAMSRGPSVRRTVAERSDSPG